MALRLIAAAKTDIGKQREQNEDACYAQVVEDDAGASGLFVVADGMGGYHAGEVAARITIETISNSLGALLGPASNQPTLPLAHQRDRHHHATDADGATEPAETTESAEPPAETAPTGAQTRKLDATLAIEHYSARLRAAIQESSTAVVAYGTEHHEARGLGSTITCALVVQGQAVIANVGDSRTYLLRDGKLQRVTQDHSLVERLVEAGQIERDDVYEHPSRNLIYRSLGAGRAEVEVDIFTECLQASDALLLCSDGLWEMVRDAQIESILNEVSDPADACDLLIQRANENGGEDNITAVLVRCQAG